MANKHQKAEECCWICLGQIAENKGKCLVPNCAFCHRNASPSPKEEHTCPGITPCCGTAKYPGGARCGNCMRCAKGFDCQTPTPLAQRIEEVVSKWSSRYERCYMNDGEYTDAEIGKFLSKKVKLDYEFNINFLKSSLTQIAEEAKAEIEAQAKEAGADGRFWHYLEIEDLQKRERQNEREAGIKMGEGIKGIGYGHHDKISRIEIIKNLKK